jgi:serine/threonine protein kinase
MTQAGVILGTAGYMSPEQARGQEADRRADVWSFGVLLHEMLAGERLFRANTVSDTLARVLMADLDWATIDRRVPAPITALLRRCLERDAKQRLQAIAEARIVLQGYIQDPEAAEAAASGTMSGAGGPVRRGAWKLVVALLVGMMLATVAWKFLGTESAATAVSLRSSLNMPPGVTPATQSDSAQRTLTFSPDGHWLVFVGTREGTSRLYKRSLEQFEAEEIPDTESADNPVFSPDSRWLGYFTDGKLHKVPIDGGPSQTLASFSDWVSGVDWGTDGTIIFNREWKGLWRVSERGGEPEVLAGPDASRGEWDLTYPHILPKGQAVLYTALRGMLSEAAEIGVLDLTTGARRR